MSNMQNIRHEGARIKSTSWIIEARWYYATLALIFGIIAKKQLYDINIIAVLSVAFVSVLVCNAYFYFQFRQNEDAHISEEKVTLINTLQIGLDLCFFFIVMMVTGGGIESIGHSFFFVPIVVSMIVFGFHGAISVAISSGFLVLISVLLNEGIFDEIFSGVNKFVYSDTLASALLQTGIIFILYLLTGFFGGYISRLIRARDILLHEQIEKEEDHVERLEELTKAFDQSAKLLVRRDLELTSANEKLTQLDKMKSEIISVVAHQLRTPLSAIKWTLKILIDKDAGDLSAQQEQLLTQGFESNERMINLVNDMLAVDRLESGKIKYNFVPVQFEDVVQEMISSLLTLATQRNIRINFVSPKNPLPKIRVDIDKIRDVLQNLIDNAIKYTKEGGDVTVGVVEEKGDLHFWVEDSGIGIPESERDHIFSRFYRASNAVHFATNGSGLGLFIAQSIVTRHGGKMWFNSVVGTGSTFHVSLPIGESV